ncbi:2OG-Fe(II) oxygenase [Aquimarina sp. ERC-38]|uniref:2OG-Fe(II) oxygenase n=1 Tax=Aquimarina sp. ERC-38 TaxID=2949996 RepID=UPI002245EA3D|nr:2OG-Fe(II) oxygenase [Aquimarina sp. ERC-38]UZO80824.1 2OG-Fe(II) oxygenase [Aquimarina sp. ERC-38]
MNRFEISQLIYKAIKDKEDKLKEQFATSSNDIGYFFIDDLLPEEITLRIFNKFPNISQTRQKKSLKEFKHVAAQMDQYDPLLEEVIYAFQEPKVVHLIASICKLEKVYPDSHLYAGGISMMGQGNYLQPHLDNSHDKDRKQWRVLNLLFYITPDWNPKNGGNLELWPNGVKGKPLTIDARFNRLVIMATHKKSWHSVSKVTTDRVRCCVSNYYFSNHPLDNKESFHVTTFRARPGQSFQNQLLKIDAQLRMAVRKVFSKGIVKNPHVYHKPDAKKNPE